jgi:hypothetical protein
VFLWRCSRHLKYYSWNLCGNGFKEGMTKEHRKSNQKTCFDPTPWAVAMHMFMKCGSVNSWSVKHVQLLCYYFIASTLFSIKKTNLLMLCGEIIHIYSENHTKHMNTLRGQNIEFMNVKQLVHTVNSLPQWAKVSALEAAQLLCSNRTPRLLLRQSIFFHAAFDFLFWQHPRTLVMSFRNYTVYIPCVVSSVSVVPLLFYVSYFKTRFFESGLLTLFREIANTLLYTPKKLAEVNDLW